MIGSYILVIRILDNINIQIGKLGKLFFKKGFHLYVGSAMGKSGSSALESRVKRHLRSPDHKKTHWHIDYLLENNGANIVQLFLIPHKQKIECVIAQELISSSDGYIKKFGCSDCLCQSHLIFFRNNINRFLKINF